MIDISILLPSRGRPEQFKRMIDSVINTANHPSKLEIICRIDTDDISRPRYNESKTKKVRIFSGPRDILSKYWNECAAKARGNIFMHAGDDLIFHTQGWDDIIRSTFAGYADHIVFVHGDDGYWGDKFGTHGFVHRKWVETIGYFVPPYFSSDYNDSWLNDVANIIGRRKFVNILTEHMHPAFGKAVWDQTHMERLQRHRDDNVDLLYQDKMNERLLDAEKLRKVMQ